jgi:Gpi18-like mannosyltransferase
LAFFPAYPLLLRVLVHGRSAETYLGTGFLLSVLFYGLSVLYLRKLLLIDYDADTVVRATLLLCFYPFAFSLAIFGPDSLCLLTACAAFYHARRGQWALAALAAALACVTRVQGVLVVPCLLYMYLRTNRPGRSILPLVFAPVTLAAFMFHLWRLTGNPLAFVGIQQAWNNAPSFPFAFAVRFLREPVLIGSSGWDPEPLSLIATFAMLAVLVWCVRTRRIPMEYCLFFGLQLVVLTCRTSTLGNLRYVTNCFPFFLALAILAKRPLAFSLVLAAFAGFFGLCASLFAAGQQHHPGYHFVAF